MVRSIARWTAAIGLVGAGLLLWTAPAQAAPPHVCPARPAQFVGKTVHLAPDAADDALVCANLTGAHLDGLDLEQFDMQYANLTGASLTKANLTQADLTGTDLTNATLTGADFDQATLHGTTMTGAIGKPASADGTGITTGLSLPDVTRWIGPAVVLVLVFIIGPIVAAGRARARRTRQVYARPTGAGVRPGPGAGYPTGAPAAAATGVPTVPQQARPSADLSSVIQGETPPPYIPTVPEFPAWQPMTTNASMAETQHVVEEEKQKRWFGTR